MPRIELDEILKEIMRAVPDLQEDQLREMIKKRREDSGDLLTDEGAAHIVAFELGVSLRQEKGFDTEIHIEDLTSGMNDVSISGRILLVGPMYSFTRENGSEGKLTRLLLGDSTGIVDVVIWDDKVDTLNEEGIIPNEMVRISHGYVKNRLNGQQELSIGKRGNILRIPDNTPDKCPRVEDYSRKIESIMDETRFVNLEGEVRQIYPLSEFRHTDGTEGRVRRILLSDNSGEIICVFWDDKSELVEDAAVGDMIKVTAASARKGRNEIELHTTKLSEVKTTKTRQANREGELTISNIRPRMMNVNVVAWVVQVGNKRRFMTKKGNEGEVVTILLADKTGNIRLNLWNDTAIGTQIIKRGDLVIVKNAYVGTWLDRMSLNLGSKGEIHVSKTHEKINEIPELAYRYEKIAALEEGQDFVSVRGRLSEEPQVRNVMTDRQSEIKIATFSLKDDTGEIDVTLWGESAKLVEKLSLGTEINICGAQVDMEGGAKRLKSNVLTTVDISEEGKRKI
jgi:replication factor A1